MKKILVAVTDYPRDTGEKPSMFVHVRNKYYKKSKHDITVLNFSINYRYTIDGIQVIPYSEFKESNNDYDILILHAANIRNHYLMIRKYRSRFKKYIFFYHGHEILKVTKDYPNPYPFINSYKLPKVFQALYDRLKFLIWRKYLPKLKGNAEYIFVSEWLFNRFKEYVIKETDKLGNKDCIHIIHNSVGEVFEVNNYNVSLNKVYDFITIRSNLDDSKYAVDIVCGLAEKYKEFKFLIIGRGKIFEHIEIPQNLSWVSEYLTHEDILEYINKSKCALLPTRQDTQGVMTCECATFGIPTITSDIEICQEICGDCRHIALISNDLNNIDLENVFNSLLKLKTNKYERYFYKNTVFLEEKLIENI